MNLDPAEIKNFSSLAHSWWDPKGSYQILHQLTPLRLKWITQNARIEGVKVLDIGCGGGLLAEALRKQGARITAIDAQKETIDIARAHAQDHDLDIDYHHGLIEDFADQNQPNQFDVICCLEMLEHVPDPSSVIRSIKKLMKPKGLLFVSTLNRNLRSWISLILIAEYLAKVVAKGTHSYQKMIKPSELFDWCGSCGLTPIRIERLNYNPLLKQFWLTPGTHANYWCVFS